MLEQPITVWLSLTSGAVLVAVLVLVMWCRAFGWQSPRQLAALCDEAAIMKMVVENASDGIVIQDIHGCIHWSNPAFSKMSGYTGAEIQGRKPQEFILPPDAEMTPEDIERFRYDLSSGILDQFETVQNVRKNGEMFWNQLSFAVVNRGRGADATIIVICRDVSEQIEREQALAEANRAIEYQATHDPLTGLANRSYLQAALADAIDQLHINGQRFAVLQVDLDHFKPINDRLGHAAGDAVLVEVAGRMRNSIRTRDIVARTGGDEFVIVNPLVDELTDPKQLAIKLLAILSAPINWNGHAIEISASIGVAIAEKMPVDADHLIQDADLALYEVKRNGRQGVAIFDPIQRSGIICRSNADELILH